MTKKLAWSEIEPQLQDLRLRANALKEEFPDAADFMPRFADYADDVREAANDDCIEDVSVRITPLVPLTSRLRAQVHRRCANCHASRR